MEVKPGYKQTEVGVIPEDWDETPLGKCGVVVMGQSPPGSTYNRNEIGTALINGPTEFTKKHPIKIQWTTEPARFCKVGDLLICVRGSSTGRTNFADDNYAIGRGVAAIRANTLNDTSYLSNQVVSAVAVILAATTGSTFPSIDGNSLRGIIIPLPPTKAEQEAIAGALSDADSLIESLEHLVAKKRQIKLGAMQQLLTGHKRLPGFTSEWERKRLGEIATLSKIGSNPASQPGTIYTHFSLPAFDAGAQPVIEAGTQIGSNKFMVPPNAVLVSKLNPRIPRIWAPDSVPENSVCSTEFLVLVPRPNTSRGFLATICRSPTVCIQMELHAIGTTGSHQRINPIQALAIDIPIPNEYAEQAAIAAILSDMDAEIAGLETKLAKARQVKQGMMQELLTGRIRLV
jgi:type I restriction enzyme S subunit